LARPARLANASAGTNPANAHFSITACTNQAVTAAIAFIDDTAWTPIRYPRAVFDEQLSWWISDAEVAEIPSPPSPHVQSPNRSPPVDHASCP
jgi:hypothetical protein